MKNLLLSIIIPCYNSARFIGRTLDMLVNQGLSDCEVICVDDGSVDGTCSIVTEYIKMHGNIHLVRQDHGGVSIARNTGGGMYTVSTFTSLTPMIRLPKERSVSLSLA